MVRTDPTLQCGSCRMLQLVSVQLVMQQSWSLADAWGAS